MTPNRLASETSPYLLQHSENPVDWYPWGPEALRVAKEGDKPILLSVGYSACHWCHVMEKESFEDPETARIMNENFVSVKVDREERPDIDSIYMDAVQAMTGRGGWPMTVFLMPGGEPFYAGTYFPKEDGYGMPAFKRVLAAIAQAWRDDRDSVGERAAGVVESMKPAPAPRSPGEPGEFTLRQAFEGLKAIFDPEWGGFGRAPKFPQPMTLEFLLRCDTRGYGRALDMATVTLDRMASGGINDQVGGGFHRYSTDRTWLVPHFEKMLYDNAQLARAYTHAWQATGHERYRSVALRTLRYLAAEMRHPGGGFLSSQDADSDGVEGKFFVWNWRELAGAVGEEQASALGATPDGNWEGTNVLWQPGEPPAEETLGKLKGLRAARVHPETDDKVLSGWNGLAISAFAEAGRAFGREEFLEAATQAADFLFSDLRRDDGRLVRSWREGKAGGPAYADDYALVADACLTLHEATLEGRFLDLAEDLAGDLLRLFRDPGGGFFQAGTDAESLVVRPKDPYDNAVPSGNSAGATVLLRLARLTGGDALEEVASEALGSVGEAMARYPAGFGQALSALDFRLGPVREIAIIGGADEARDLAAEVWSRYLPNHVMAAGGPGSDVALLREKKLVEGKPAAYVCERFVCLTPVTEPAELARQLDS